MFFCVEAKTISGWLTLLDVSFSICGFSFLFNTFVDSHVTYL